MIKTKVAFLEGRLLSIQSKQFERFLKSSDWLEKSRPSKKALLFWSYKQANYNLRISYTKLFSLNYQCFQLLMRGRAHSIYIACLHDQNKSGFLEGGFYPANQSNLKWKIFRNPWLAGKISRPSKKATFV